VAALQVDQQHKRHQPSGGSSASSIHGEGNHGKTSTCAAAAAGGPAGPGGIRRWVGLVMGPGRKERSTHSSEDNHAAARLPSAPAAATAGLGCGIAAGTGRISDDGKFWGIS
jgi:hypothetical protein